MNGQDAFRKLGDLRKHERVRKGMFVLPSLFTAGNIAAGYYAIYQVMQFTSYEYWRLDYAARAIGFAIFFDGLDGRIARATGTASAFGKELDSLADMIAFGVAPAALAFVWGFRYSDSPTFWENGHDKLIQFGLLMTFLYLVAGASRLARFNITVNPQPSNPGRPDRKYFVGMAIPAGAGVVAAIVHLFGGEPIYHWYCALSYGVLLFAIGYLMVSTWRYPSFKEFTLLRQTDFRGFIILAILLFGIAQFSKPTLFLLALSYALSGVCMRVAYWIRRPSTPAPPPQPPADATSSSH